MGTRSVSSTPHVNKQGEEEKANAGHKAGLDIALCAGSLGFLLTRLAHSPIPTKSFHGIDHWYRQQSTYTTTGRSTHFLWRLIAYM